MNDPFSDEADMLLQQIEEDGYEDLEWPEGARESLVSKCAAILEDAWSKAREVMVASLDQLVGKP